MIMTMMRYFIFFISCYENSSFKGLPTVRLSVLFIAGFYGLDSFDLFGWETLRIFDDGIYKGS